MWIQRLLHCLSENPVTTDLTFTTSLIVHHLHRVHLLLWKLFQLLWLTHRNIVFIQVNEIISGYYSSHFFLTKSGLVAPLSRFLQQVLNKFPERMNKPKASGIMIPVLLNLINWIIKQHYSRHFNPHTYPRPFVDAIKHSGEL